MGRKHEQKRRSTKKNTRREDFKKRGKYSSKWARIHMDNNKKQEDNHKKKKVKKSSKKISKNH